MSAGPASWTVHEAAHGRHQRHDVAGSCPGADGAGCTARAVSSAMASRSEPARRRRRVRVQQQVRVPGVIGEGLAERAEQVFEPVAIRPREGALGRHHQVPHRDAQ